MKIHRLGLLIATAGLLLITTHQSSAAVIASERFDYEDNSNYNALHNLNGGTGWAGAWTMTVPNNATRLQTNIKDGQLVMSSKDVEVFRPITLNLATNKTMYVAVDMENISNGTGNMLLLLNQGTTRILGMGKGNGGTKLALFKGGTGTNTGVDAGTSMNRLVLAIDQITMTIRLYINPDLSAPENIFDYAQAFTIVPGPTSTNSQVALTSLLTIDNLRLYVNPGFVEGESIYEHGRVFDNIVASTTWEGLAAIPEPGTIAFGLIGAATLFGLSRRRKHAKPIA